MRDFSLPPVFQKGGAKGWGTVLHTDPHPGARVGSLGRSTFAPSPPRPHAEGLAQEPVDRLVDGEPVRTGLQPDEVVEGLVEPVYRDRFHVISHPGVPEPRRFRHAGSCVGIGGHPYAYTLKRPNNQNWSIAGRRSIAQNPYGSLTGPTEVMYSGYITIKRGAPCQLRCIDCRSRFPSTRFGI